LSAIVSLLSGKSSPCFFWLLVGLSVEIREEVEEYNYVADEEECQRLWELAVVRQKAQQVSQHDTELHLSIIIL